MKKIGVWIWGCLLGGMVAACDGGNGTHGEEPDFTGLDSLIQGWVDKGILSRCGHLCETGYGGFVPQVIRCRVTGHSGLCGFCRKVGGRSGGGRRGGPDGTVVGRPGGEMAAGVQGRPERRDSFTPVVVSHVGHPALFARTPGGQLQPFGFGRSGNLTFGHRIHARDAVRVWRPGHAGGRTHGRGGCGEGI